MHENKSNRITRDELYELVWQTPIVKLADQFGISDRGLSKICKRLDIPTPGRGYWARKAAGKHVIQYQLPEPDANTLNEVVISEYGGFPVPKPESQSVLIEVIEKTSHLKIPDRLTSPHPVIKVWLDEHKDRKEKEKAAKRHDPIGRSFYKVEPITAVDRRRYRILHVLFKELEKNGYIIKSEHFDKSYLEYNDIRVEFVLREKLKQVRRPLTEKEKNSYFTRDKPYIQELEPTGKLHFSIRTHIESGLRHEWNETTKKTMEDHLPEILAILITSGPILVKREEERKEAQRRYREEEQLRYEREQAFKKDQNQWQQFLEFTQAWQQAKMVREYIAEIEKNHPNLEEEVIGERTLKDWVSWAHDWADKTEPTPENVRLIFDKIARTNHYTW